MTAADYETRRWPRGRRARGQPSGWPEDLGPLTSAFLKIAALCELGMVRIRDAELAACMTKG